MLSSQAAVQIKGARDAVLALWLLGWALFIAPRVPHRRLPTCTTGTGGSSALSTAHLGAPTSRTLAKNAERFRILAITLSANTPSATTESPSRRRATPA